MAQFTKRAQSAVLRDSNYWVVSPNVRDDEGTVEDWRAASVRERAAFMGYSPNDEDHPIGPRFAGLTEGGVMPGDVILIARRRDRRPEMVGFGVVEGKYARTAKRVKPTQSFGSLRALSPFKPWSQPPPGVPLIKVLQHTQSLVRLHPDTNAAHRKVCEWIEEKLRAISTVADQKQATVSKFVAKISPRSAALSIVDRPESHQLDYTVQTQAKVRRAKKIEAALVDDYEQWLEAQDRKLAAAKYANLQCDGFEQARQNLIEAKSSTTREHIRMAVGQLLDYAFQGKSRFGSVNKAILLPKKPEAKLIEWLKPLEIAVIWREGTQFFDDANGQFT